MDRAALGLAAALDRKNRRGSPGDQCTRRDRYLHASLSFPNAVTSAIHDRMPVVLSEESADQWLDPNSGALGLEWLCLPLPDEALLRYRVGLAVNSVHSDSEACLRPAPEQTEWEF